MSESVLLIRGADLLGEGRADVLVRDGRIAQVGTAHEILDAPANDYVREFTQDVDRTRVLTAGDVMDRSAAAIAESGIDAGRHGGHAGSDGQPVFVVDASGRPVGVVGRGGGGPGAGAPPRVDPQVVAVPESAPLRTLFRSSASTGLPLAVVDSEGRLCGTITQDRLLEAAAVEQDERAGAAS